jgi:hypothetical protein
LRLQVRGFLGRQLEHEVLGESVEVSHHLFVQAFDGHPIEGSNIRIEQHLVPAQQANDAFHVFERDELCFHHGTVEGHLPHLAVTGYVPVHGDPSRYEKLSGTSEMARIINNNVGYACHRYIVHLPGTDPLCGLAFAAKGSPIGIRGSVLMFSHRPSRREARRRS